MISMLAAVHARSQRVARRPEWSSKRRLRFVSSAFLAGLHCLPGTVQAAESAPVSAGASVAASRAECAQSFEQAQRLRNAFRYLDADAEALKCANPACGPLLSEECGKIYGELQAVMPSIVFVARDENGNDLPNASVEVDGKAPPISVDGTPVAFDPGNHEFRFAAEGFEPLVQSVVISTGERLRPLIGVLKRATASSAPQLGTDPRTPGEDRPNPGVPLATYVLGGVGLVGFAGFVGFRVAGAREFDALSRDCKPVCSQDAVDAVKQKYLFSNIALAVGGAATVAAVSVYLFSWSSPESATAIQVWHSGDGAGTRVTGSF
jgi:hypothetical protein